jgi:hypothetical protein
VLAHLRQDSLPQTGRRGGDAPARGPELGTRSAALVEGYLQRAERG